MAKEETDYTRAVMSLVRTSELLNKYLEGELSKNGSTPFRFAVMNALVVHGGAMNPTSLSKWTFRAKHTLTPVITLLEKIGFVTKKFSKSDRRSYDVAITEKGWEATEKMTSIAERISRNALACFDQNEKAELFRLLKKMRKHLYRKLEL